MMHRLPLTQDWPLPLRRLILEGRDALGRGDVALACDRFKDAIRHEPNIPEAHLGLALARRPGPDYVHWLERLHTALRPRIYLEIGVETGRTLRLAQPPTIAIGIDPSPDPQATDGASTETRMHLMTSQAFFASAEALAGLPGPVDLAFIDGDHGLASVLHDFMQVEAISHPDGVIVLHDTWPLNSLTAARTRETGFYTGDCWKLLPCLRTIRPDLHIVTIATPPTGLTVLTRLDPASTLLRERFQAIIDAFSPLPYPPTPDPLLALRDNTPDALDHIPALRAMATAKSS